MRGIVLAATMLLATASAAQAQVTRGDLKDRDAADSVENCADQFLSYSNPEPAHEVWIMCLQAAADNDQRDPMRVAEYVIDRRNSNVFDAEGQPMTSELEARIRSGI